MIDKILKSQALDDLLDIVLEERLKQTRQICIQTRDNLNALSAQRPLTDIEQDDWQSTVQDIFALDRVLDLFNVDL